VHQLHQKEKQRGGNDRRETKGKKNRGGQRRKREGERKKKN
jgi:hypothetical protein